MAAANNRAKIIGKLHNALKKQYKPTTTESRPLLEHILYGSLLQDAPYELADEGIAKCEQEFFDWNEVRVTTVTELTQVLANLPDPKKAAARLKGNLQDIFEEFYSFDIDHLKKENLGKAVAKFERMPTMTPFVLAYATQHGLGGHSIPIDYAALVVMLSTGVVSQNEAASGKVPGLERAVPKNKGVEFSSLLHQCAVDLMIDPKHKVARSVLDATVSGASKQFDEWCKSKSDAIARVRKRKADERKSDEDAAQEEIAEVVKPKKGKAATEPTKPKTVKKTAANEEAEPKPKKAAKSSTKSEPTKPKAAAKDSKKSAKKPAADSKESVTKVADKKATPKKATAKKSSKTVATKKTATKKTAAKKTTTKKSATKKASTASKSTSKKATTTSSASKKTAKKTTKKTAKKTSAKKSDNRKLSKRKPR